MLDPTIRDYIKELQANHEKRIKEIENNFETKITGLKNDYAILKEKYDLVIYKRFARSAEQLLLDGQQSLFVEEDEPKQENIPETEMQEIKSYARKKPGRKPIDPNIPRVEEIIDIPDSKKIYSN